METFYGSPKPESQYRIKAMAQCVLKLHISANGITQVTVYLFLTVWKALPPCQAALVSTTSCSCSCSCPCSGSGCRPCPLDPSPGLLLPYAPLILCASFPHHKAGGENASQALSPSHSWPKGGLLTTLNSGRIGQDERRVGQVNYWLRSPEKLHSI